MTNTNLVDLRSSVDSFPSPGRGPGRIIAAGALAIVVLIGIGVAAGLIARHRKPVIEPISVRFQPLSPAGQITLSPADGAKMALSSIPLNKGICAWDLRFLACPTDDGFRAWRFAAG